MNQILEDYIGCVRKRLITDKIGEFDAAAAIAKGVWDILVNSRSRNMIRDNPALREALAMNMLEPLKKDMELRRYLKEAEDRNG